MDAPGWLGRWRAASDFPTWQAWGAFLLQACLVVAIELSDDTIRGFLAPRPVGPAEANALRVVAFEQAHGLWIEPGLQQYFEHAHRLLGLTLGWGQVVPIANAWYGIAHGLVTALVAAWIFWRRRRLFPFVRNVFLFSTALSVVGYNLFPVAPPRLATGLLYQGRPYHFVDTVFQGGGVDLSFDKYAAMPSLHIVWALIAGWALAWEARPLLLRVLGLCYPLLMGLAVIVTGNHYVLDCLGGVAVVIIACALALAATRCPRADAAPHARRRITKHAPA